MNYVYHRVPSEMKGDTLCPLNELKDKFPDAYKKQTLKYKGREQRMKDVVPPLDCLWNDVLHFSPVHPALIQKVFKDFGKNLDKHEYFEIPADFFPANKTIIYLNEKIEKTYPKNWISFNPALISKYSQVPDITKKYYKEKFDKNEQPLLYSRIPHVLYKGIIDTKNLKRIIV